MLTWVNTMCVKLNKKSWCILYFNVWLNNAMLESSLCEACCAIVKLQAGGIPLLSTSKHGTEW